MNLALEYVKKLVRLGKLNMYHVVHFFTNKNKDLLWYPGKHQGFSYWYAEECLYIVRKWGRKASAYFFVFAENPEEAVEKAIQQLEEWKK